MLRFSPTIVWPNLWSWFPIDSNGSRERPKTIKYRLYRTPKASCFEVMTYIRRTSRLEVTSDVLVKIRFWKEASILQQTGLKYEPRDFVIQSLIGIISTPRSGLQTDSHVAKQQSFRMLVGLIDELGLKDLLSSMPVTRIEIKLQPYELCGMAQTLSLTLPRYSNSFHNTI